MRGGKAALALNLFADLSTDYQMGALARRGAVMIRVRIIGLSRTARLPIARRQADLCCMIGAIS